MNRVISHKDAKRSYSLGDVDANPLSELQGERRISFRGDRGAKRELSIQELDYGLQHA